MQITCNCCDWYHCMRIGYMSCFFSKRFVICNQGLLDTVLERILRLVISCQLNDFSRVDNVSLVNMHFIPNYKNILFWCSSGHSVGNIPRIRFRKSLWYNCYVCWRRIVYCKQNFSSCAKFCLRSLHSWCSYCFNLFISVLFIQISSKKISLKKFNCPTIS